MSDLDERLVRYARHLDEHLDRFEVRADDGAPVVAEPTPLRSLAAASAAVERGPSHRVWLATAAAICLLAAGSLAWWRSSSPGPSDVGDTPTVTAEPTPDDPLVVDTVPDATADSVRWHRIENPGGVGSPLAATSFKGGVLAVSSIVVFSPRSWWAPDGRTFEEQVDMEGGTGMPRAIAADDEVAVAVGDGTGEAKSWVTADGRTWEVHQLLGAASITAIAHTPLGFVAVGSSGLDLEGGIRDKAHPAAWSSPDGRVWTRLPIPDDVPGEVVELASSPDEVVLVGYVEGAPWAARFLMGSAEWRPVPFERVPSLYIGGGPTAAAWTGERFVASGGYPGTPAFWELTDAGTFAPASIGTLSAYPTSIVGTKDIADAGGTTAVVVDIAPGEHGMSISVWTSTDAGDWRPAAPIDGFPVTIESISGDGDGRFIAIADGGVVWVGEPTG